MEPQKHTNGNIQSKAITKHLPSIVFAVLFIAILLLNIKKLPCGFGGYDESLYSILPVRYLNGAKLIVNEWNLTQFSSLITTPVVWLYGLVNGSYDGLFLFMRWVYLVFHSLTGILFFILLKKESRWSPVFAASLFLIFTPYDIMSCSYNTIGLDFIALICAYFARSSKPKLLPAFFCGMLFGITVLGTPFLFIGFVIYSVVIITTVIRSKSAAAVMLKPYIAFAAGGAVIASGTAILLLVQSTPAELAASLPAMMNDPNHGLGFDLAASVTELFRQTPVGTWQLFSAYILILLIVIVDKNRISHKLIYLLICGMISIAMIVIAFPNWPETDYHAMYPPLALFGLAAWLMCSSKPKRILSVMYSAGWVYSICIHLGSNNGYYAFSMALMISCLASVFFIEQLIRESLGSLNSNTLKRAGSLLTALVSVGVFAVCGTSALYIKRHHCYWDVAASFCDKTVQRGPAKGLRSTDTSWNYSYYDALYYDLEDLRSMPSGQLLIVDRRSWLYFMAGDHKISTYSPWLTDTEDLTRLGEYYALNPDEYPDYIYIPVSGGSNPSNVIKAIGGEWQIRENVLSYIMINQKGSK